MTVASVRPFALSLVVALFAALFGQGVGVAFGAAEPSIKASLAADAQAVLAERYGGDAAKAKAVSDKSFAYLKRAHLHGGALGTLALAVAILLMVVPGPLSARRAAALASSVGALGYGLFWLFAGLRAPGMGGTDAAKESLAWLAWSASALVVVGTVGALALVGLAALRPSDATAHR